MVSQPNWHTHLMVSVGNYPNHTQESRLSIAPTPTCPKADAAEGVRPARKNAMSNPLHEGRGVCEDIDPTLGRKHRVVLGVFASHFVALPFEPFHEI